MKVDEIDWVEAEGNYVRLHIGAHSHLLRETMKGMEAALDPERFIRIHRSTIVNTERIKELQPLFHGEYAGAALRRHPPGRLARPREPPAPDARRRDGEVRQGSDQGSGIGDQEESVPSREPESQGPESWT